MEIHPPRFLVSHNTPPCFSQVFILKRVKVLCFDALLQVFILKGLTSHQIMQIAAREAAPPADNS